MLNLDHNHLERLDLGRSLPRLRMLRLSGNTKLAALDVLPVPRLRTLYADFCSLDEITNLGTLTELENLSVREQVHSRIAWPARELRDARRLFFSGNALPAGLPLPLAGSERFFNLVYLELAACQLAALPAKLPQLAPNLRSLNLDYNLFAALPPLQGLERLKRLSLVGCRIKRSKPLVQALRGLSELQVLDVR